MANEVRARLILEGDASAAGKAIDSVNEKAKALNKTMKEFNVQEAADNAARMIQERALLQQELIRRGTIADPEIAKREAKAKADAQLRMQSQQSLAMAGLSMSGLGGVAGGYGHGLAIGSALEGAGYAGLARFAGPAGAAIGAGKMALDAAAKYERFRPGSAYANPYFDQGTRDRGFISALPFGESTLGYIDAFSGRARGFEQNQRKHELAMARSEHGLSRFDSEQDIIRRQSDARAQLEAVERYQRPGIPTFDRSTATGERQTREAEAMQGSRERAVMAERQLFSATKDRIALENRGVELAKLREATSGKIVAQERIVKNLLESQGDGGRDEARAAAKKANLLTMLGSASPGALLGLMTAQSAAGVGKDAATAVPVNEARQNLDVLTNEQSQIIKRQGQNERDLSEARRREAEAQRGKGEANIGIKRAELDILKSRESIATGQAQSLGAMGIGGRLVGLQALEYLKQNGAEYAAPELISQAASVAPIEVRKMLERVGENLPQNYSDRLRALAPEDARDLGNIGKLRNDVDRKQAEVTAGEQRLDENYAGRVAEAAKGLKKLVDFLSDELPIKIQNIENNFRLLANQ